MIVAIVGRPNVGKSTLFNRLVGRRQAIVEDVPGVTRDRHYAEVEWGPRRFHLVDTGGLETDAGDELITLTSRQARYAVEEADLILFVADVRQGLLPADRDIGRYLRQRSKDVILVVNKVDGPTTESAALEFHDTGFPDVIPVSAEHGRGVGELVGAVEERVPVSAPRPHAEDEAVRVAVLGRPNVGKSSLVNRLLGEERLAVSAAAGTTRDPIDTQVRAFGRDYVLIDTAGIRRKTRVEAGAERWSALRAIRAIDRAHVCLILIDATEGFTDQDARILNLAQKGGRGAVLVFNKWDAAAKDAKTFDRAAKELRARLGPHGHVPILSLSALTGQRVPKVFEAVQRVHAEWVKRVPTSQVNAFLEAALRELAPPVVGGKRTRIYYMTQVTTAPPRFAAFASHGAGVPVSYERFLVNRLRNVFGFEGVPLTIRFRSRSRPGDGAGGEAR
ncbi:MAG: ribosome biogenesis GTPase Der [Deferrisomatales bacterium]|nr:ribosome biogenesis GTPase Der [Deferrisomatales bacterium]